MGGVGLQFPAQIGQVHILALQDLVSPVAAYVRDRCEVGIGHEIAIADLLTDWRIWCEDNGHKPGSVQTFGRDLRAVIPHLRVVRPREGDNNRERRCAGVKLSATNNDFDRGPSRTGADSETVVRDGPQSDDHE